LAISFGGAGGAFIVEGHSVYMLAPGAPTR